MCGYTAEQRHTQVTLGQWVRGRVAFCRSRSPRRLAPICGFFNRHLALRGGLLRSKNLPVSNVHKAECEPPLELQIRRPDHAVGGHNGYSHAIQLHAVGGH